jgi:GTP cyclohydrolase I
LFTEFENEGFDQIILLRDIELYSLCEHHLMSFSGKAHVAYIPNHEKIVGISKLARLVDIYARRLQIQERIGKQVVNALVKYLEPIGAACIIEAKHLCIACRGVGKQNAVMVTSALRGVFMRQDSFGLAAREELMRLIRG